jgi:hypothetical protein
MIPRCSEGECPGWLSIETFHRHPDQFTGDTDTAPEKGELGDAFADRVAGIGKQLRRDWVADMVVFPIGWKAERIKMEVGA